ncbi:MAG: alkaline phosphatase family protein, partial [Nitrospirales bacterium]|nr:alkaline phosphatase family protein [Nitrospirales bacterium]
AWLSLFSGVSRSQHGYYYNRQLMPGTYDLRNFTVREAQALPFWAHLRGGSKKVAIIDALETEILPGLPGFQLANWAVQKQYNNAIVPPSAEPASLLNDAHRHAGPPIHIDVFKPDSSFQEDVAAYRLLLKGIEEKGRLGCRLLAQDRCDLAVITFVEAHTAAHRLWDYRSKGIRQTEATSEEGDLSTAIRDVYQAIDREMGLLLKQLSGESNVFVVSLFGMKDLYPTSGLIEAFCRQLGYQVPSNESLPSLNPISLLRRVISPDVRARLSLCFPRRLQMWLETNRYQTETNWAQTKAFSIPALNTSFVRVNLLGREPQGIVKPGSEYEGLLYQIETDLKQLVDVRSGEPAVERVIRTAEAFRCGPPLVLPDLSVEWKSTSYLMDRVRHPKVELVQARPQYNRSSYHTFNGFVAAAGPSIRAGGELGEVSPLDFAPLFQSLMGEPVSQKLTEPFMNQCIHPPPLKTERGQWPTEVS